MKTSISLFAILVSIVLTTSCANKKTTSTSASDKELDKLTEWLTGDFSSSAQAKADTNYFDISLSMRRIWEDRTDGVWLYVEQAVTAKKNQPYRQRVYKLNHPSKDLFTSEIYTISNASEVIGLQDDPAKKSLLTFDKIEKKDGCTVNLQYEKGWFVGGTHEKDCPSDLRGASYATTEIKLNKTQLISWDRGYNSADEQVWGATLGGYIFIKK